MPVPIRITYRDGTEEFLVVSVNEPRVTVDLPLRGEPDDVEFNPFEAVLANVR